MAELMHVEKIDASLDARALHCPAKGVGRHRDDDPAVADAENIARWLAQVISPETPLHLSRYFPRYRWHSPETSPEVLDEAFRAASRHLNYVYVGNAHRPGTTDTRCPDCGRALLERMGLGVRVVGLTTEATCDACGRAIPVRGMAW